LGGRRCPLGGEHGGDVLSFQPSDRLVTMVGAEAFQNAAPHFLR
jgi:hypothetical protein